MGIEMEADKPGWYDAMNGLPGLFGASLPENYALQQLLDFLLTAIENQPGRIVKLPIEVWVMMSEANACLQRYNNSDASDRDFNYWHSVSEAREAYREAIRLGFDGREHQIEGGDLSAILGMYLKKVRFGAQRALVTIRMVSHQLILHTRLINMRSGQTQPGTKKGDPTWRQKGSSPSPYRSFSRDPCGLCGLNPISPQQSIFTTKSEPARFSIEN